MQHRFGKRVAHIDPTSLYERLARGEAIRIVDVREACDTIRSPWTLPGALKIPLQDLPSRRDELAVQDGVMVILVSSDGITTHETLRTRELLALDDVRTLDGGLETWIQLDLPLV